MFSYLMIIIYHGIFMYLVKYLALCHSLFQKQRMNDERERKAQIKF